MGRIYKAAEETLIWLGPADNKSDLFMDVWRKVGKAAEERGMMDYHTEERSSILKRMMFNVDPDNLETREFHKMCHEATSNFTVECLNAMIEWHKKPWFSRIWVIQEYSLSSNATFVCGYQRMSAEHAVFAHLVFSCSPRYILENGDNVNYNEKLDALHALSTKYSTNRHSMARWSTTLYRLLRTFHVDNKMKATEPCDLIWGLLGLAVDSEQLGVKPDYDRKDQVELIFTEVTKAIIGNGNVDVIALSQFPKTFGQLPSWVPDWRAGTKGSFSTPGLQFDGPFAASKTLPWRLLPTADIRTLGLSGFTIDQIERIGMQWQSEIVNGRNNYERELDLFTEVNRLCRLSDLKNHNIYASHSRRAEAKWRVPAGGIQYSETFAPERADSSYAEAYSDCLSETQLFTTPKHLDHRENLQSLQSAYDKSTTRNLTGRYRTSMDLVNNKRLFLSRLGYVGMGPLDMRPEDSIVVFKGARIPYIIRPVEEGEWRFVGECYCDGIMDGENLELRQEEDFYLV